ncbi:MAG: prepilin peptidase [Patescibacteria group bacterium]
MQYFFLILIFWFGAALGSFVAVIANRHNTGLPFLKGRSICFSCNAKLQKKDLIPIFSFLFLKGKCGHCGSKIPKETIIIEILMGVLSVLAAFKSGFLVSDFSLRLATAFSEGWLLLIASYLLLTAIFANILLISVYDLKHFIIPDSFLVSLFIFSLFYTLMPATDYWLLINIISGIVLAIPFLLIFLISKGRWLGFGDVKYILVLGFLLGFIQGLSAIVLSFWIGAAFSLIALFLNRLKPHINLPLFKNSLTIKSEVPFGPFLSLGIIISFYLNLDLFQIHELFNIF